MNKKTLIIGGIAMIPITIFLVCKFNFYFLAYPLVYAAWAVNYANIIYKKDKFI